MFVFPKKNNCGLIFALCTIKMLNQNHLPMLKAVMDDLDGSMRKSTNFVWIWNKMRWSLFHRIGFLYLKRSFKTLPNFISFSHFISYCTFDCFSFNVHFIQLMVNLNNGNFVGSMKNAELFETSHYSRESESSSQGRGLYLN